jgi:hypothetical protein
MRRLTRYLFTLCAAVSLLLCVAVCVLWVRSSWSADQLWIWYGKPIDATSSAALEITHFSGRFLIRITAIGEMPATRWRYRQMPAAFMNQLLSEALWMTRPGPKFLGLRYGFRAMDRERILLIPDYFVALVTMILPGAWMRLVLPRLRKPCPGKCRSCGYDLRASPERCPECGTANAKGTT